MAKNENMIHKILETKMDRKDFLTYTAALALTFTGIGAVSKTLMRNLPQNQKLAKKAGYGISAYGS